MSGLESMALTTIGSALALVYQAYTKIKTNKERCKVLYDQCLLINNRLEAYVTRHANSTECERMLQWKLKEMQRTYQYAAETIERVGSQSYIMALLKTEENAALITDTQYSLNQLVSVLALEHAIDVASWQRKNSVAYKKDQNEIIKHYKRQEQDMTVLKQEVASYGSSVEQIQGILSKILQRLDTITTPTTTATSTPIPAVEYLLPNDPRDRPRSFSSPSGTRPNMSALLQAQGGNSQGTSTSPPPSYATARRDIISNNNSSLNEDDLSRVRRLSLASGINIPNSGPSVQGPRSAIESSSRLPYSTSNSNNGTNNANSLSTRRYSALSPLVREPVCIPRSIDFAHSLQVEMQRENDVPETPPPAYSRTDPDPFATSFGSSRNNNQTQNHNQNYNHNRPPGSLRPILSLRRQDSVESLHPVGGEVVVDGDDYEIPTPIIAPGNMNSRFDPDQLRDLDYEHTAQKVREALKKKDVTNFSIMKSVGWFGDINTRILVEMNELPRARSYDEVIPLDCFEPNERDTLHLIKSRLERPGSGSYPPATARDYNHVLMLCPQDAKPNVIVMRTKQPVPQQAIKAYIVNTERSMTLVSVKDSGKKTWVLIPYRPSMRVWEAKQYIQSHFRTSKVVKCRLPSRSEELQDTATLLSAGVRAYDHDLQMTVSHI